MADPLSITAGVVGLISFGIQVTGALVDYYSAYEDQDSEVARTIEKLKKSLRRIPVSLHFLTESQLSGR
jgi:hypothetical protein